MQALAKQYPNINNFLTKQVHHSQASKYQQLNTREVVVNHVEQKLKEDIETYICWVKAGSQANHLSVRGKQPDFDILFVVDKFHVSSDTLDSMFVSMTEWEIRNKLPLTYLESLKKAAQTCPNISEESRRNVRVTKPSVSICCANTDFDLLPAIQLCDMDGNPFKGLYLVPCAEEESWVLSFSRREKKRFKELDESLPGLRDALKILKFLNQSMKWGLPSIALTSVVWHASEVLRIYKWPNNTKGVSWTKVHVLHKLLMAALQARFVAHMFHPTKNVLADVNISTTLQLVQECIIE